MAYGPRLLIGAIAALFTPSAFVLAANGDDAVEVFNDRTIWRFHVSFRSPVVGTADELNQKDWEAEDDSWSPDDGWSPAPEPDWAAFDFDDSGWPRQRGPIFGGCGDTKRPGVALLCVRGRFGVIDPGNANDLQFAVEYRGGAIVYLNGTELARGHLPEAEVQPLTLADDYSLDTFMMPDGRRVLPSVGQRGPRKGLGKHYRACIRRFDVEIPSRLLRKGTNVPAIELHRAAIPAVPPKSSHGQKVTTGTDDRKGSKTCPCNLLEIRPS